MRFPIALFFASCLAIPALAGGNRPLELPPRPVGLPDDVVAGIDAARKLYASFDDASRRAGVAAFGKVLNAAADSYIIQIGMDDPHPGVRLAAIETLTAREHPKAAVLAARLATSAAPQKYRDIGADMVRRSRSAEAIALLIEAMKKGSAGMEQVFHVGPDNGATTWSIVIPRSLCAHALGRIATKEAVAALVEALSWPDWELRMAAAQALGEAGDASAVKALLQAAGDQDLDVQCEAMIALGRIGGADARALLQKAAKSQVEGHSVHYEEEVERNEVYVRIAERALKLSTAARPAPAPIPAPPPVQQGPKGGSDTYAEPPPTVAGEGDRVAPPVFEADEAGEDLLYICETTITMSDAREMVKFIVDERIRFRDHSSDFRFGFVAYRDYQQQYLTDQLFFTRDMEKAKYFMRHVQFTGGGPGQGTAADKALSVALMLDWSKMPRRRAVLISDTFANDNEDLYFRGKMLHEDDGIILNTLHHTHADLKRDVLKELAVVGGGHSDYLPGGLPPVRFPGGDIR